MPLADRFDGLLIDLDGVVWIGREPVPGSPQAHANRIRKPVFLYVLPQLLHILRVAAVVLHEQNRFRNLAAHQRERRNDGLLVVYGEQLASAEYNGAI